jgi:calpain-7
MVKLWLNGVARRVLVDDLLPVDRQGTLLCSHTTAFRNNTDSYIEFWVPIIEKAYMKLCGGYDFPGSNSTIDLFSLTGWIPERLYLAENDQNVKDFETHRERAWERLYFANNLGDCLITLANDSNLPKESADEIGLVTKHAYAVLSVFKTRKGIRLLQLKNPWAQKVCFSLRILNVGIMAAHLTWTHQTHFLPFIMFTPVLNYRVGGAGFHVMTKPVGQTKHCKTKLATTQ